MRAEQPNPKAIEFQNSVTGTVLPAIRETDGYNKGEGKLLTGEMTENELFALALVKAHATLAERDAHLACQEGQIN